MMTSAGKDVYKFIKSYILKHGYAPSYREINENTRIKSTSTVSLTIKELIKEGYLETDFVDGQSGARAYRLKGQKILII